MQYTFFGLAFRRAADASKMRTVNRKQASSNHSRYSDTAAFGTLWPSDLR